MLLGRLGCQVLVFGGDAGHGIGCFFEWATEYRARRCFVRRPGYSFSGSMWTLTSASG
jgi:hypothetical protein